MKNLTWLVATTAVLVVCACGGGSTGNATGSETTAEPQAPPAEEAATPTELGEQAAELYAKALGEVVDLMQGYPAAAELQPKVEALKERYVTQLVELGKKREALNEADRKTFDLHLRMGIGDVPSDVFTAYSEGQQHYQQAGDSDLANLISEFNVITQYTNFELLKKQAPDEAKRLGIE
jgi:hypothetical protein